MIEIAYSQISYGSSGSDVKKLQEVLNKNGYSLDVDGKFGPKTQAAVKDYQKKKGLKVDGIVGEKTWGSLNSGKAAKKTTASKKTTTTSKTTKRPVYEKSKDVLSAEKDLQNWENNKPKEYESKYSEKIDAILNDILNRPDFSYDLSSDPLYEQYRELYIQNGKKAMMDTIGQATALTGGYSNSYAETVGSQAYQEYLNELNGIALDLRDRAYDEYQDEGDALIEDVTLLRNLDGDDYEKYLGMLEQYYSDGDYLLEKLVSMSDAEFEEFLAEVDAWESDRDYEFKKYQDKLDREEFEKEMAFKKAEAQRDQRNADREYSLALKKLYSSGSKSSKSSGKKEKSGGKTLYPQTYKEFCSRTGYSGIMTRTEFDSSSAIRKLYKDDYLEYLKEMYDKYSD